MLADRAQHDDTHALIRIQRLERTPKLVALRHRDDVERRPVEDDVAAALRRVHFDAEPVGFGWQGGGVGHAGWSLSEDVASGRSPGRFGRNGNRRRQPAVRLRPTLAPARLDFLPGADT